MAAYSQPVHSGDEEFLSEHFVSLALAEVPAASLSGDEDSRPVDLNARTIVNSPVDSRSGESRFLLSTGATYHISPELSDFKTLTPILPRPVKDLSGNQVYAVGLGTIDVHIDISTGHKLTLQHALFVPFAKARLISVQSLCRDGMYTIHFGPESCRITDSGGNTVARGTVSRNLYVLSVNVPFVTHLESAPLQL